MTPHCRTVTPSPHHVPRQTPFPRAPLIPPPSPSSLQMQAALAGCVPVVISDNVLEAFEPFLDWNTFGVRLAEKDIPQLHQVLAAISPKVGEGLSGERERGPAVSGQPGGVQAGCMHGRTQGPVGATCVLLALPGPTASGPVRERSRVLGPGLFAPSCGSITESQASVRLRPVTGRHGHWPTPLRPPLPTARL